MKKEQNNSSNPEPRTSLVDTIFSFDRSFNDRIGARLGNRIPRILVQSQNRALNLRNNTGINYPEPFCALVFIGGSPGNLLIDKKPIIHLTNDLEPLESAYREFDQCALDLRKALKSIREKDCEKLWEGDLSILTGLTHKKQFTWTDSDSGKRHRIDLDQPEGWTSVQCWFEVDWSTHTLKWSPTALEEFTRVFEPYRRSFASLGTLRKLLDEHGTDIKEFLELELLGIFQSFTSKTNSINFDFVE